MEDKKFDQKITELLSQRDLEVSEHAWQKVADQLPGQPTQNHFKWMPLVAAMLIIGFLLWFYQQSHQTDHTLTDTDEIESETIPNTLLDTSIKETDLPLVTTQTHQPHSKNIDRGKQEYNKPKTAPLVNNQTNTIGLAQHNPSTNNNTSDQQSYGTSPLQDETEIDVNALVLKKLKSQKTQYTIDPNELLQLAENEIQTEKDKRFRDKVIEKVKTTVHDWNVALK
jgi:hypothetical protein